MIQTSNMIVVIKTKLKKIIYNIQLNKFITIKINLIYQKINPFEQSLN